MSENVIPQGSTCLVTGVNGYIASHVADQFLQKGYKVRGTAREKAKAKWLEELFEGKYGEGVFEVVVVGDLSVEGAFDEAIKGVSGIAHVASVLTFSSDPEKVITPTVKGAVGIMESALKEPGVKSFVFTSSSCSALMPKPDVPLVIKKDTWNEESGKLAWSGKGTGFDVYGASKTEAEKAVWKFVEEKKPHFQVSAILPNANFGEILGGPPISTTGSWIPTLYEGDPEKIKGIQIAAPQHFVNVADTARLHVAAMIDPTQNGERIFAFTSPFNLNDILATIRKLYPEKKFIDDDPGMGRDLSIIPNGDAEELLKKHYGKGFVGFEETVVENIKGVV